MSTEKSASAELKEKLFNNRKNGRLVADEKTLQLTDEYCEGYKQFLDAAKTEREAVKTAIRMAEDKGFVAFERGKKYQAGDKVYINNRGKTVAFAVIGEEDVENGVNITAAHIDSPRLDLKPNPLYEELELALFKTHYYGGIRKYQWPTVPLALHGAFAKKDGSVVEVSIGEQADEPKFVVNDLLPHLAKEQSKRTLSEGIQGEELNILIGSHPFKDDAGSELVKLNIMKLLNEKYDIVEEDFLSAELEAVPAVGACDIGFDRTMIGAYGQDDRVCAYPALTAVLNVKNPKHTALAILTDKEEIGSCGNTGLESDFLRFVIRDLAMMQGGDGTVALRNSKCLSADVNAAMDPTFQGPFERRNASKLNYGVVLTKYTGARGKAGTSDASAEYTAEIRSLLDRENIIWQSGELGKVDEGGGGTVAQYIANLGVDVIDLGVPVLSMHAPFETTAKLDVYMCYRAMYEFMK
ncbi:MAG: aminopeptidase [Clostridia bacterium]|nr:aminopeptidase [Clostridia bacterium]